MSVASVTKRCGVCGRFRSYEATDEFCVGCGTQALESECTCGRVFDFALDESESADLHCPRCGRALRGRAGEFTS